jgi:ATP-binding cassette subfamily F protein 3
MNIFSQLTVFQEAMSAFNEALEMKDRIDVLSLQIAQMPYYQTNEYSRLVEKLNQARERYNVIGGFTMEARTEKVLLGLGFRNSDFSRHLQELSGGWQMRVEIAKILLSQPDLLLLDEPTNHLDIESIQWLEEFLINYPGAVIIVSHDRALLDHVTNRTIEISLGRIYDYKANYSGFVEVREQQREKQMAAFSNQQRQIAQIERFIERFRYKNTKARQVQSRIKLIEKMDKVELEETDNATIQFTFPSSPRSGKVIFEARHLTKSYDSHPVLKELEFAVIRDDAIAFVGRNGEGKTTLSRIIIGELAHERGESRLGHQVSIGYFAQNQAELLDPEKTVFQTIDDLATGEMRSKIRTILGSFLFGGDSISKKVKVLSGGEKSRLAIACLLLKPVNLLVLDEPTNHLDMYSKDVLKNALLHYKGTLIIVSHDRDFLQGLTNKVFEFRDQGIRQYLGDIYDYLESRKLSSLRELEMKENSRQSNVGKQSSDQKLKYELKKQYEREYRKLANQIKSTEERIEILEKEIKTIDSWLADPVSFKNELAQEGVYTNYGSLKAQLEEEILSWERLHAELEEFEKSPPGISIP